MELDSEGEVVVALADGWTLRSGCTVEGGNFTSGEWVRLVDPDGVEYCYWDQAEWAADPVLVMGAILNSAAGLRMISDDGEYPSSMKAKSVANPATPGRDPRITAEMARLGWDDDLACMLLSDVVHDVGSERPSQVNNNGFDAQIEYIGVDETLRFMASEPSKGVR